MAIKKKEDSEVQVIEVERGQFRVMVVGSSPIILNRMADKARRELLLPKGKKTAADKAANLKHDPLAEFRSAPDRLKDEKAPTLLAIKSAAFHQSMASAALDMPGAKKAQIGRLSWIEDEYVPIFGTPKLFMSVVRSADMNRTPDIRTRCIIPRWACEITVTYAKPIMREQPLANLLAAAGLYVGVGDWRPEKGKGSYGQFRLASSDDAEHVDILKAGGRAVQSEAMESPEAYDDETEELLSWYQTEATRRGFKAVS